MASQAMLYGKLQKISRHRTDYYKRDSNWQVPVITRRCLNYTDDATQQVVTSMSCSEHTPMDLHYIQACKYLHISSSPRNKS